MTPVELAARLLEVLLDVLGAEVVREQVDAWEAARIASDTAFRVKYGEEP